MKRKIYRSSATVLLGSFFLFALGGCSPALNFSTWLPSWGQDEGYFAAQNARQDIQGIYRLACAYQEKNQHQMALEEFKRVLRLNPNHAQSYNGMGISHDRLGNYSRAVGCYTAALKINPDLDYVHNNLGYSYLLQGQAAPAAATFQKAIALNKTNDRYRNNLGVAYAQMGKVHMALAEFKSTEKEEPAPPPAVAEKPEILQVANRQTEEKAPVTTTRTMAAELPTGPARVKTATNTAPSLPIGVEPAPQVAENSKPAASAGETAQQTPVTAKPAPGQTAAVESKPQVPEKMEAAPEQTAPAAPERQIADAAPIPSPAPATKKPLAVITPAKQAKKQLAGKVTAPESPAMPTAAPPRIMAQPLPAQQMFVAHKAQIEVMNGTGGKGLASWWGNHLRQQGVPVAQFTTAGSNYAKTKIYYCEGFLQEAYQLAKKIPLYQNFERVAAFEDSKVKVRVVIGRDMLRFAHKTAERIIVARADI